MVGFWYLTAGVLNSKIYSIFPILSLILTIYKYQNPLTSWESKLYIYIYTHTHTHTDRIEKKRKSVCYLILLLFLHRFGLIYPAIWSYIIITHTWKCVNHLQKKSDQGKIPFKSILVTLNMSFKKFLFLNNLKNNSRQNVFSFDSKLLLFVLKHI